MRIGRVFPRRTRATPVDALAFVGDPDLLATDLGLDAVHISVAFEWDIPEAERLARHWKHIAPVRIGGPGVGMRGETFTPGEYLRPGYVITSRGCPNHCWFCSVPQREGAVRTLPITEGHDVLDDNLLACPESHVRGVFIMLQRQVVRCRFSGGLDASRLQDWHIDLMLGLPLRPEIFLAYDDEGDEEPLRVALNLLAQADFQRHKHLVRVYVLCGYPGDTIPAAENRLRFVLALGATPMAMLYRGFDRHPPAEWKSFQRLWVRPSLIYGRAC